MPLQTHRGLQRITAAACILILEARVQSGSYRGRRIQPSHLRGFTLSFPALRCGLAPASRRSCAADVLYLVTRPTDASIA